MCLYCKVVVVLVSRGEESWYFFMLKCGGVFYLVSDIGFREGFFEIEL